MFDFIDYSFLLVALAIFGFIIKDIFNSYRKYTTPYDIMKPSEKFFSYISTALIIITFFWLIFMYLLYFSYQSYPDGFNSLSNSFVNPFYQSFSNMVKMNLITQNEFVNLLKSCIAGSVYMTVFSFIYTAFYCFIAILGIIYSFFETRSICVYFDNWENKKYRRIIYESSDFFYLESIDNFRNWQAIPKSKVINIENILSDSNFKIKFGLLVKASQNNPHRFGKFVLSLFLYFVGMFLFVSSFEILFNGELVNFSLYLLVAIVLFAGTVIILKNVRDTT